MAGDPKTDRLRRALSALVLLAVLAPATAARAEELLRVPVIRATARASAPIGPPSDQPDLSESGRYAVFVSEAPNLVPNDTNGVADVFLRDLEGDLLARVSVSSSGAEASGPSSHPSISDDGRIIVFASAAPDLAPDDTNGVTDVFVRDRRARTTTRVSLGAGEAANGPSFDPVVSADGRWVAFASAASNLLASGADTNGVDDVFTYDRSSGAIARVSVSTADAQGDGPSSDPSIATDDAGPKVAFASDATNLVGADTDGDGPCDTGCDANGLTDVFLRDGTRTERVSISVNQRCEILGEGNGRSYDPAIATNPAAGTYVAFTSEASNFRWEFGGDDGNNSTDVLLRSLIPDACYIQTVSSVSDSTKNGLSTDSNGDSFHPSISLYAARFEFASFRMLGVGFASEATNLVDGDTNGTTDVFFRRFVPTSWFDIGIATERFSMRSCPPSTACRGGSQEEGNGASTRPVVTLFGGGVFTSSASNLVERDVNGGSDVFVRTGSWSDGTTSRVSEPSTVGEAGAASGEPSLARSLVAFASDADDLVGLDRDGDGTCDAECDTNGVTDVFLRDRGRRTTVRVSVTSDGKQANGPSYDPMVSALGDYVVFVSDASNLVGVDRDGDGICDAACDTNGVADVFLRRICSGFRATGDLSPRSACRPGTVRLSASAADLDADGASREPSVFQFPDSDGAVVAFTSDATNLVPGDTNEASDVFVGDLVTGTLRRASVSGSGEQADGPSYGPSVAGGGLAQYRSADPVVESVRVAFTSRAGNLAVGDGNGLPDIFVRDLCPTIPLTVRPNDASGAACTPNTTLVSVVPSGIAGNGTSDGPAIDPEGRWVAFASEATDLVGGDLNGLADVFVRDLQTGVTTRVSVPAVGGETDAPSSMPTISSDFGVVAVAFESAASNLVGTDRDGDGSCDEGCDTDGARDAFVTVLCPPSQAQTTSVTATTTTEGGSAPVWPPSQAQTASVTTGGGEVRGAATHPSLQVWGGRCDPEKPLAPDFEVAFVSADPGIVGVDVESEGRCDVACDENDVADVFVHGSRTSIASGRRESVTSRVSVSTFSQQPAPREAAGASYDPVLSAGGDVAFSSEADNLIGVDTTGDGICDKGCDANGRVSDVFVRRFCAGGHAFCAEGMELASVSPTGAQANRASFAPSISRCLPCSEGEDGRYVAFVSYADNLACGAATCGLDRNFSADIFVRDLLRGTTERVSVPSGASSCSSTSCPEANGWSASPSISGDGRFVAFVSNADNLVPVDLNWSPDVFVRDRVKHTTIRVAAGSSWSASPAVALKGRTLSVVFTSESSDLIQGDVNGAPDVFLWRCELGPAGVAPCATSSLTLVSRGPLGAPGDGPSYQPTTSADGNLIAFTSDASNLLGIGRDANRTSDVYLYDPLTRTVTTSVSVGLAGAQPNGRSFAPAIAGDGRSVAFVSTASNLVAGDTNTCAPNPGTPGSCPDVFVRQLCQDEPAACTETTARASVSTLGIEANGRSFGPSLSYDGTVIVYYSIASTLLPPGEDRNGAFDVFVGSLRSTARDGVHQPRCRVLRCHFPPP